MDKINKNPEIRFKGFTEDWKEIKFEEIFIFSTGKNIKQKEASPEFKIPCIRYGELYHMYGEVISTVINRTNIDATELLFSKGDEILLPSAGEDPLDIGSASALTIKDIAIGRTINILRPKNSEICSHIFLSYYINQNLRREISSLAKGVSISNVYNSDLKTLRAKLPSNTEQKKIGSFFQNLDNLITLHQKKYDKLVILKKAMLVKMFPKKGALVPEIRFKGFTGDWEEMRLGDFAQIKRGLTYSPIDVANKGIKVLRSSNILEDTFVQKEDDVYVNDKAINIDFARENDILITSANGSSRLVGKHAILKNLNIKAVHGGFMLIARTKNPYFLNASMSSPWYRKFINMNMAGGNGAIGNLKSSDLEEYNILTPHKDEQQKIGKYFQNLDNQIELHKTQLDKLINIKKACFSKMFVAQD